jgi:hypothetical protein
MTIDMFKSRAEKAKRETEDQSQTYYDFDLPSGLKLGDATREQVEAAAMFYSKQAKNMQIKGRWLESIAETMKGKTKEC